MSFIINSNGFQAQTASYLKHNFGRLNTSLARLGSGDRIVKVQDDSAAISVSEEDQLCHNPQQTCRRSPVMQSGF